MDLFVISQLISQSVSGTLSDEEQVMLEKWRTSSPQNEEIFQEIIQREKREEDQTLKMSFDKEMGWNNLVGKRLKMVSGKKSFLQIASYAAALIIGIVSISLLFIVDRDKSQSLETESLITSGKPKAQLTLSTGVIIELDVFSGTIETELEKAIMTNEGNRLVYTDTLSFTIDEVLYNEITVPRGGEYRVQLSDGTFIYLNAETWIRYPVRFSGERREVEISGEAWFDVVGNKEKPFIVKTIHYDVLVTGTSFNISSYNKDTQHFVTLEEGRIEIHEKASEKKLNLNPNQMYHLNTKNHDSEVRDVNALIYSSWKDGKFRFINERFEDIAAKIERWYDVEIEIKDEYIKNIEYTIVVDRFESIHPFISVFENELKIEQHGKKLIIKASN